MGGRSIVATGRCIVTALGALVCASTAGGSPAERAAAEATPGRRPA
jgi:hypothetical protein